MFKSNQDLHDGEIMCSRCNKKPIKFKDLVMKIIHKKRLDTCTKLDIL